MCNFIHPKKMKHRSLYIWFFLVLFVNLFSQNTTVDKIIAVIGKEPVLQSELEGTMMMQEKGERQLTKCQTLEQLVFTKLLITQADKDSVTVTDAEVDAEMNKRFNYYILQFGSEEKLEEFYGKRINVIKDELRSDVEDQMLAQRMQQKITGDLKLSPAEVRLYYNQIPSDSLPLISSEMEILQLVRKPPINKDEKLKTKQTLESYRQRVLKGESMNVLAALYSEDPGSAKQGGLIENVFRGQMVPEFEATAFKLKAGEISEVFETSYGYHFIQMVARRGEMLDLRHILLSPKMTNADYFKAKTDLDSIKQLIENGTYTFEQAVKLFSDDTDTKQSGGILINQASGSTKWTIEDISTLDEKLVQTFSNMKVGDLSPIVPFSGMDGKPGFRLFKLKNRTDPHKANMKEDYARLLQMATTAKQREKVNEWITRHSKNTYIKIDDAYKCQFEKQWILAN
jgi:peptidyl-prolyl cis-trans isomerase SurA